MNNQHKTRRPIRTKRPSIYSQLDIDTTIVTAEQARLEGTTAEQLRYVARHHTRVANEEFTHHKVATKRLLVAANLNEVAAQLEAM